MDDHVKMLLSRCNKIKVLFIETLCLNNDSLKNIRKYLNLTLEELTLAHNGLDNGKQNVARFLQLKSMARLQVLKLYNHDNKSTTILNIYLKKRNCFRICIVKVTGLFLSLYQLTITLHFKSKSNM